MRGFKDHIPPISYKIDYIKQQFEKLSALYGCDMIDLPLVETAQLYFRTSGLKSDICNKELFEVRKYKGEFEDWVLRPEGTASCMRAIKEANFMQQQKFARFAYFGPMFRYNRPQKGRYRQFLHAGWEFVGAIGPESDAEIIIAARQFLEALQLDFTIEINSIGSAQDRLKYRQILGEYYQDMLLNQTLFNQEDILKADPLKVDSLRTGSLKFLADPLKFLDKAENINDDTPKMELNLEDASSFEKLCDILQKNNISFVHNPFLVRGLDYYNALVFEFKVQNQTVLAGGRYDGLMEQLGGQYLPAVGFAAGVDRICDYMNYAHVNCNIGIIPIDADEYGIEIADKLRQFHPIKNNINNQNMNIEYDGCVMFWNMNLKKALQEADKQGYRYVIICAAQEQSSNNFILKDLVGKTEYICSF